MKKILLPILLFVLVVAACSNESNNNNVEEKNADNQQSVSNNNDENSTDNETNEPSNDKNATNADKEDENGQENQTSENDAGESDEDLSVEDQLKDLSLKIFAAQKEEDYEYLEDILTDSGTIDKEGNVFHFEGEYEHDMEFIQEPEDNLEYRYVHESDDHTVYVGYGVVDYETESSYTIDLEFVQSNGEWKLQNIDKNA